MDLENISKSQIVLLTLLVSFVTSIATGIVTVTLLDQAPPEITQTINRIVERTVERVVPDVGKSQGAGVVTKEVTIVVKEDDLITSSIEKNSATLVRIFERPIGVPDAFPLIVGIGVLAERSGFAATARGIFTEGFSYTALTPLGDEISFSLVNPESVSGIALLELQKKTPEETFAVGTIPESLSLKLGQTVIALSGNERTNVSIGIIAALEESSGGGAGSEKKENATTTVSFIHTNLNSVEVLPGSPLLNIFGEMIGIRTFSVPRPGTSYIPSSVLVSELAHFKAKNQKNP